jgi:hypothetical protein
MDEEQHVLRSFCVHGTDQLFVACTSLQHEMTLVNKADADRDTIDDYMQELDSLHRKQLLLIHSLEDVSHELCTVQSRQIIVCRFTMLMLPLLISFQRLKDYHESRGTSGLSTAHAPAFGILEDDDSFEDLRDD